MYSHANSYHKNEITARLTTCKFRTKKKPIIYIYIIIHLSTNKPPIKFRLSYVNVAKSNLKIKLITRTKILLPIYHEKYCR